MNESLRISCRKSTFVVWALLMLCCGVGLAQPNTAVQQGELRLDGQVKSVAAAQNQLVLTAHSFTNSSGNSSNINPAKAKTILFNAETQFLDNTGKPVAKPLLSPGIHVAAIGTDAGSGKALTARILLLLDKTSSVATKPAPSQPSEGKANLQTGEFALAGQVKGIFSAQSIVIDVFKRVNAAGRVQELGQPMEQKLHLSKVTKIYSMEDAAKLLTVSDIELGQRVSVVGKYNSGDNPSFQVREMGLRKEIERNLQTIGTVRVHPLVSKWMNKGDAAYRAGAVPEALRYYKKASQTAGSLGDFGGNSAAQNALGLAYASLNQPKLALQAFQTSVNLANSNGDAASAAIALNNMGDFLLRGGDAQNALKTYDQALGLVSNRNFSGKNRLLFSLLMGKAQALGQLKKLPQGIRLMQQATGLAKQLNNIEYQLASFTSLGFMQVQDEQFSQAKQSATTVMSLIPQLKDPQQQASSWVNLYILFFSSADDKQALHAYDQATLLYTQLKNTEQLSNLKELKARMETEAAKKK